MEITERQQKQLKKLSKMERDSDVILLQSIDEVKEELNDKLDTVTQETISKIEELLKQVSSIEIPIPKDYTDHINNLQSKIDEPLEVVVKLNIT